MRSTCTLLLRAILANVVPEVDPRSTSIVRGSPAYTVAQHFSIVIHMPFVVMSSKNLAALKCVPSSTICNTGLPSKYMTSIITLSLNWAFSAPQDTLNLVGAFCILWQGPRLEISSNTSKVSGVVSSGLARFKRSYNFAADGCISALRIFYSWDLVKRVALSSDKLA